jgi:hypothetical protein
MPADSTTHCERRRVDSSGRLRRLGGARAALIAFVVVELVAIPVLLSWGHKWWFWADDWDFLGTRTGGNLSDLFRAHYQHWVTLPILAYRLLWWVFGIRTYVPYQLLIIALHLVTALLLRTVMRRAGVRPWFATLTAGVFVFFGSGAENIVVAFQITFVGALMFGLVQLLLADHDGPVNWLDALALAAGLAALMCSGVAIATVLIVGIAMLLRRGWKIALLQTVPLLVAYGLWSQLSPKGPGAGSYKSQSPVQVVRFMWTGAGATLGRLAQVPGLAILLTVVVVVGLGVAIARLGAGALRGRLAVPIALLVGAGIFLLVTGLVRSGAVAGAFGTGPDRARQSRYVYIVAALLLPTLGIAADAIARRWRVLTIPVVVLLLAGLPGNLHQGRIYANLSSIDRAKARVSILAAPRLPNASLFVRSVHPAPFYGLTMGWLVDSLASGRIPSPGPLTPKQIATQTLNLALRPAKLGTRKSCGVVRAPEQRVLQQLQRISLLTGSAKLRYISPAGVKSLPLFFAGGTSLISMAGPIRIEIAPYLQPTTLCG